LLGTRLEQLAKDASAKSLFNEYFLGVYIQSESTLLLEGHPEGTVALLFSFDTKNLESCYMVVWSSSSKQPPLLIESDELEKYGNLHNYIQSNESIKYLVQLHDNSILAKEFCELRNGPSKKGVAEPPPFYYPKLLSVKRKLLNNQPTNKTSPAKRLKTSTPSAETQTTIITLLDDDTQAPQKKPDENRVKEWSLEEVKVWVQSCEDWNKLGLPQVPQQFSKQRLDGSSLLMLNQGDLPQLGISKIGPQKRFMDKINQLKQKQPKPRTQY